ncbi:DUF6875 domain-containing protein [Nocardia higoensis]|uniref:DUF6875 domain-containing protein n=1 Tax=Nocardia higoensis TaxID=228599 RepID=UPI0002EF53F6|nr:hypothetical protein [Nocardia higoensis]
MSYRLCEPDPEVAARISRWLVERIGSPHPELGREGPICPFAVAAHRSGTLMVLEHRWQGPHELGRMVDLVLEISDRFRAWQARSHDELGALVVVVTGLPSTHWRLIDEAHRQAKPRVVATGIMVGQFHPECPEPSVHNRRLAVNTAPLPLFAVRHMALHDILFLREDPDWFAQYRRRFGHRFDGDRRTTAALREVYEQARVRYSPPPPRAREFVQKEASWKSS